MSEENKKDTSSENLSPEEAKRKAIEEAKRKFQERKKQQEQQANQASGADSTPENEAEPNFEPDTYKETTPENNPENNSEPAAANHDQPQGQESAGKPTAEEKRVAAEKAKAAAAAKAKAAREGAGEAAGSDDDAKAKAIAAAKAAAAAKAKAAREGAGEAAGSDNDAKAKAIAAAKAKAAAAAKAKAAREGAGEAAGSDDDAKAKAIAAAKAKAAAAAKARAAREGADAKEEDKPKEPSKNQPYLDNYVKVIKENIGEDVIEEAYINELAKEVPTLVIKNEKWFEVAQFLKHNEQLAFDYLSDLHGSDFESHLEVYYHFYSYKENQSVAIRVKTDREQAVVASVTPIWFGGNWPEREAYDLLGIQFQGHPNLTRILLTDDWVGYPLRKDYDQFDEEV